MGRSDVTSVASAAFDNSGSSPSNQTVSRAFAPIVFVRVTFAPLPSRNRNVTVASASLD